MDLKNIYLKKNNIFQTQIWAEFQGAVGREALEVDGAFFYKDGLAFGKNFLFCPKGKCEKMAGLKEVVGDSVIFVRVEPDAEPKDLKPVNKNSLLSQQYSPKQTLVLDLTKPEDELLSKMKSKHRYNIRLAEKKGVKVVSGYSKDDVGHFYKLSLEVSKRDKTFSPHNEKYYQKMAEILGPEGKLLIFTAFFNEEPISSILILFYNDTAIYLHGASANKYRELMPNHLAQWEAIKEAKKRGCKYYDFWGAAFLKDGSVDENHSWAGITKFKAGFVTVGETGEIVTFKGAYDLILRPFSYKILCLGNKFRKLFR